MRTGTLPRGGDHRGTPASPDRERALTELLALVGPTASGKSAVALRIAERIGASILSVDSMQVYRGMDIGTAKPGPEERSRVPHFMLDLVDPAEEYSVAAFQHEAREVLARADGPVVISGGSGLHFRAVVDPLEFPPTDPEVRAELEAAAREALIAELTAADPHAGDHVDLNNPRRVVRAVEILRLTAKTPTQRASSDSAKAVAAYQPLLPFTGLGIDPGEALATRVQGRLQTMRERGLLDEVRDLAPRMGRTAAQAVGYKELIPVVNGELDADEGFAQAEAATLDLARSQRTYFGRDPRIEWLTWEDDPDAMATSVLTHLDR